MVIEKKRKSAGSIARLFLVLFLCFKAFFTYAVEQGLVFLYRVIAYVALSDQHDTPFGSFFPAKPKKLGWF
jgi:hypothetical protein